MTAMLQGTIVTGSKLASAGNLYNRRQSPTAGPARPATARVVCTAPTAAAPARMKTESCGTLSLSGPVAVTQHAVSARPRASTLQKLGKLLSLLAHPGDLPALMQAAQASKQAMQLPHCQDPHWAFCYDQLNKVSRSYAVVIQQLPEHLRDANCMIYLAGRALDTIQDDMLGPRSEKIDLLENFHQHMHNKSWHIAHIPGRYGMLLQHYPIITEAFLNLPVQYQTGICRIMQLSGEGYALFLDREIQTMTEYNSFCHYALGVVAVEWSRMFAFNHLGDNAEADVLSGHIGMFLQKMNTIRDFLEDVTATPVPRLLWPKEIWSQYAANLQDLLSPMHGDAAVNCLNHMICDALQHACHIPEYLALVDPSVLRFSAVAQVMALATLVQCWDNPKVFSAVVKVRRGQAARYLTGLGTVESVLTALHDLAGQLLCRCQATQLSADTAHITALATARADHLRELCEENLKSTAAVVSLLPQ